MKSNNDVARERFFTKQVHMQIWKDSMAGENEDKVIEVLEGVGFVKGKDFERQYPIGGRFVIDIAFPNEQVAIEVDGKDHQGKKRKNDIARDRYMMKNNWIPIRIKDKEFFGYQASFYKSLIKAIVDERRGEYNKGTLMKKDLSDYNCFINREYD